MRTTAGPLTAVLLLIAGSAAAQDTASHGSTVLRESGQAAGALAESGVKTAVGVSVAPVRAVSLGSSAVGVASIVTGSVALQGAAASGRVVTDSAAYSRAPLKVDDEVIIAPQPAPNVPYRASAEAERQRP